MKRLTLISLALVVASLVWLLKGSFVLVATANAQQQAQESTRDAPPDTTPYSRPAVTGDFAPKGTRPIPLLPSVLIVDTVVNNTDPNITNTDTFNDGETSITANPANPTKLSSRRSREAGVRMRRFGKPPTAGISGPSNLQSLRRPA